MELLEKAEASQLEVLLDPVNLLVLLHKKGHSGDDVRATLRTKKPGELLLMLLESDSPPSLIALLPPGAREPRSRPATSHTPPADRRHVTPFARQEPMHRAGMWILASSVVPALLLTGFLPEWQVNPTVGRLVAGALGALGGALFSHGKSATGSTLRGLVLGTLAAEGGVVAVELWTHDRVSVFLVEICLALMLGALPAGLAFWALTRRAQR